jgi:hypothetical protein
MPGYGAVWPVSGAVVTTKGAAWVPQDKLYIGPYNADPRSIGFSAAVPTSGHFVRGAVVWRLTPATTESLGWRCLTSTTYTDPITVNAEATWEEIPWPGAASDGAQYAVQTSDGAGDFVAGPLFASPTQISVGAQVSGVSASSVPFRWKRVAIAGAASQTLTAAQYECVILEVASTGDGQTVTLPLSEGAFFIARNTGSCVNLTFGGSSGSTVTVDSGGSKMIYCDGTNYYPCITEVGA